MTRFPTCLLLLALLPSSAFAKTVTGRIETVVVESVTEDGATLVSTTTGVRRTAGKHAVRVTNPDDRLEVGATMRVRGTLDPDRAAVLMDADDRGATLLREAVATPARGVDRLAVIHLGFPDVPRTKSLGAVLAAYPDMASWFQDVSQGQWTFTTLGVSAEAAAPLAETPCFFNQLVQAALDAADPQLDYRTLTYVNVVVPWQADPTACFGTGWNMATIGRTPYKTADGKVMLAVHLTREDAPASIHELGHSLGLTHAMRYRCPTPGLPTTFAGCVNEEYGDPFDPMGQGWRSSFTAARLVQLGWMPPPVLVTAPGFFALSPVTAPAGLRALRLVAGARRLWLETRGPSGVDPYSVSAAHPDFKAVHVHGDLAPLVIGSRQLYPADTELIAPSTRLGLHVGDTVALGPWRVTAQYRDPDGTTGVLVALAPNATPEPSPTPCDRIGHHDPCR